MKRLLSVWGFLLMAGMVSAQMISHEVIASGGDYGVNGNYNVSSTFGEIVTETMFAREHFLTQGFQQPSMVLRSSPVGPKEGTRINVFPNPVSDYLKVTISLPVQNGGPAVIRDFMIDILNLTGNQVTSRRLAGLPSRENMEEFDVSSYARGIYIIRIYSLDDENTVSLNFKIVKM